jgi:hypothetical protein
MSQVEGALHASKRDAAEGSQKKRYGAVLLAPRRIFTTRGKGDSYTVAGGVAGMA